MLSANETLIEVVPFEYSAPKVFNVKQMAQTYNYLREHGLLDYAELEEKAAVATEQFHALSAQIKAAETRMAEIAVLKTHIFLSRVSNPRFSKWKCILIGLCLFEVTGKQRRNTALCPSPKPMWIVSWERSRNSPHLKKKTRKRFEKSSSRW